MGNDKVFTGCTGFNQYQLPSEQTLPIMMISHSSRKKQGDLNNPSWFSANAVNLIVGIIVVALVLFVIVEGYNVYYTPKTTGNSTSSNSTSVPLVSVRVSGHVKSTGQGTSLVNATFASGSKFYVANISNDRYSVSLFSPASYKVSLSWEGNYTWQKGVATTSLLLSSNGANQVNNFTINTPDSSILISGQVETNGTGTRPIQILFSGREGETVLRPINNSTGQYETSLPNFDTFAVSTTWQGAYSWQTGTVRLGNVIVNMQTPNTTITKNWQFSTPSSYEVLSGNVTTSGGGTFPTKVSFSYSGASFFANVTKGKYFVQVGNHADYLISIDWSGAYPWQSGRSSGGAVPVDFLSSTPMNMTSNLSTATPNSDVNVSGVVTTTGSGTKPLAISYSGPTKNITITITSGAYAVLLPNLASYNATVSWAGNYSWQEGSVGSLQLKLNAGAGISNYKADWKVTTPDSLITVYGTVNSTNGVPYQIEFISRNGQVDKVLNVSGNGSTYSAVLPNQQTYVVVLYFVTSKGKHQSCNPGLLPLYVPLYGNVKIKDNLLC